MLSLKFRLLTTKQLVSKYYTNNLFRTFSTQGGNYDLIVVGAGIIGCACAREIILRNPDLKIAIVEKECALGLHQTLCNSGVVHAGIYYKPGSLKAKLCKEGMQALYKYCDKNDVPYRKIGKLIVATNPKEVEGLKVLEERSRKNEVPDLEVLDGLCAIQKVEPHCIGLKALWSPHTGIVDFRQCARSFVKDFTECGGELFLNFEVVKFSENCDAEYPVAIHAKNKKVLYGKYALTCGGLYSDKLAIMAECDREPQIIPFRGEYLKLKNCKKDLIKGNIYPVPDPKFPFLGVHFTPRLNGDVLLGPNAVLAFAREGYSWKKVNIKEFTETIKYPGFRKMAFKYVVPGLNEAMKSLILSLQMKHLQRYVPEITKKDVEKGPAGVRAQAMYLNGELCEDFVFSVGEGEIGKRVFHCRNVPSPAGTSSLAIAHMVTDKINEKFDLGL